MFRLRASLHRDLALAAAASFIVGASSVHCGGNSQTSTNGFTGPGGSGTSNGGASGTGNGGSAAVGLGGSFDLDVQVADYSAEQIFQNDPPPTSCDGGGMPPPNPGGTPQCPDDKNLPGCPCTQVGQTAACWTGLRKDRGHGDCKDGMTVCTQVGESLEWGACNGEVLPVAGATGKAACGCFSSGYWQIDNLSPCFVTDASGKTVTEGISTDATTDQCPSSFTTAPQYWSTDTLTVDCAGTFTLCYTIKAGNPKNMLSTDCVVAEACVSAYYPTANQKFTMPELPGWLTDSSQTACAQTFYDSGGYGEMSVVGQSDQCETVPNHVFQTVTYCPLSCNGSDAGMCGTCQPGGGGSF